MCPFGLFFASYSVLTVCGKPLFLITQGAPEAEPPNVAAAAISDPLVAKRGRGCRNEAGVVQVLQVFASRATEFCNFVQLLSFPGTQLLLISMPCFLQTVCLGAQSEGGSGNPPHPDSGCVCLLFCSAK